MSVTLFCAAELADVAVAATTGPIYTHDSQRMLTAMALYLAEYSKANTAAHNASYPDHLETPATAEEIEAAAAEKDLGGKLEVFRQHGASVAGIFAYNAVAQNGRDCLAEDPAAAYGLAMVLTQVIRRATDDADDPAPPAPEPKRKPLGRAETIKRIRTALKRRSGKTWSVTGGRGTAWGWLRIDAPPARRKFNCDGEGEGDYSSKEDRAELAKLLGLKTTYAQGESIPSGSTYWDEYVDRAEGREPTNPGKTYWD